MNLKDVKRVIGSKIKALALILLALITCTCNGQKLTLERQNTESQIDYSLYFGKPVKQTIGVTEFVTLKTDDLDLALWQAQNLLIKPQYPQTVDLVYSLSQVLMLKNVYG